MILVDTSVWVEFLKHRPSLFPSMQILLEQQQVVAAECVFGELLQGIKDSREETVIVQYWENLPKRDEQGMWIEAGLLSCEQKWISKGVGLIDAFLICLARKYDLKIWTLDKKLAAVLKTAEIYNPSL